MRKPIPCLVAELDKLFQKSGHVPNIWQESQQVQQARYSRDTQRQVINEFWRYNLGRLPQDTMQARFFLTGDGSDHEWVGFFKTYVLPVVVAGF